MLYRSRSISIPYLECVVWDRVYDNSEDLTWLSKTTDRDPK